MSKQTTWSARSDGSRLTAFPLLKTNGGRSRHHHHNHKSSFWKHGTRTVSTSSSSRYDFSDLPQELVAKIGASLSYHSLKTASLVCRSWCEALRPAREATKFLTWGKQFKHGRGDFKPNVNNALKMFLKAAELGSTKAMVDAGLIFWERGDKDKAFGLYREAAEAGDRNAQGNLGMWYLQVEPPNSKEAVKWLYLASFQGHVRAQYQLAICLYQGRGADRNMKEAMMASNKASSDDNSERMKRRRLREMFPANKGETNESIHVSTGFYISVFEGMSLLKSEVAAIKSDVGRLRSTLGCLEPNIETLRQKIIEVQDLACELKVGGIEGIVGEVIHVVTTMWPNTLHKVAENVIQPMDENGEHNLVADIRKESRKRKFCLSSPLSLDSRVKHRICEEIPANEVDRMEDKRMTGKAKEKNGTVEEAKHRKRNKKFPLMGKISRKDSKVLKFLFRKPRRGHKSRDEVACSGEFGVSHEDIQCLWPTVPISSKVINIWTAYMSQTKSNSWFLPTFFAEQAGSNEDPSNVPVSIASTIVACGLQRFHRRLKHCVEIFIPLYDEIADHWFLLVMKLKEKIAELWDSVPEFTSLNRRLEIARATMLLLQTVFGSAMTKSSDAYYNFPSFRLSFPEGNQTTDNKYDSGIYIMMQMKCYSDKWFEGYNSEEMRSALALEIVNNSSNELLKSVMRAVMKGEGCGEGISNAAKATKSNAEATQSNAVVATDCDTTTDIIHEKVPNGRKCRSHRRRKSRV